MFWYLFLIQILLSHQHVVYSLVVIILMCIIFKLRMLDVLFLIIMIHWHPVIVVIAFLMRKVIQPKLIVGGMSLRVNLNVRQGRIKRIPFSTVVLMVVFLDQICIPWMSHILLIDLIVYLVSPIISLMTYTLVIIFLLELVNMVKLFSFFLSVHTFWISTILFIPRLIYLTIIMKLVMYLHF